jgi:hypothetical protein
VRGVDNRKIDIVRLAKSSKRQGWGIVLSSFYPQPLYGENYGYKKEN